MTTKCLLIVGALAMASPAFAVTVALTDTVATPIGATGPNDAGAPAQTFEAARSTPCTGSSFTADCAQSVPDTGMVTTIVEPSTWALLAAGLGVVGLMAKRRKI